MFVSALKSMFMCVYIKYSSWKLVFASSNERLVGFFLCKLLWFISIKQYSSQLNLYLKQKNSFG